MIKWCFLIVFLFPPNYVTRLSYISWTFDGLSLMIGIFAIYINYRRGVRIDRFVLTIILMQIWMFFSTLIHFASITSGFKLFVRVVVICYLLSELIEINATRTYNALNVVFHIYIIINTVTLFLFPNAMYLNVKGAPVCWFLGEDNYGFSYYLLANILALCHGDQKKSVVLPIFSVVLSVIFAWKNDIVTGKICVIVMALFLLFGFFHKLRTWISLYKITIFHLVLFYLLIFNRVFRKATLLFDMVGRNLTFSGRTIIWDLVLEEVSKKPVFGHGVYSANMFEDLLHLPGISSAHNYYLMIAFQGGIVALILFACIIVVLSNNKTKTDNVIEFYLLTGIFIFMLREQFETGGYEFLYVIFVLYYHRNRFMDVYTAINDRGIVHDSKTIQ